jgi:hypothetical protein
MRSVSVVLPESMWAEIPMLRMRLMSWIIVPSCLPFGVLDNSDRVDASDVARFLCQLPAALSKNEKKRTEPEKARIVMEL